MKVHPGMFMKTKDRGNLIALNVVDCSGQQVHENYSRGSQVETRGKQKMKVEPAMLMIDKGLDDGTCDVRENKADSICGAPRSCRALAGPA